MPKTPKGTILVVQQLGIRGMSTQTYQPAFTRLIGVEEPAEQALARAEQLCESNGYQLIGLLGAGTTSATFEAKVASSSRAIKIFTPNYLSESQGVIRRRRINLIGERLRDVDFPHLARIYEVKPFENTLYMMMRREQGRRLLDVLELTPIAKVRDIIRQIAAAALHLTQRGVYHGDLKSENILISNDFGHAVLIDIGYDTYIRDRYSSPEYVFHLVPPSREFWMGQTFYQLGALLHDLIMKERLFEDVTREAGPGPLAYTIATRVPEITSDAAPQDLVLLARRALDKSLSRRLATVRWVDFLRA